MRLPGDFDPSALITGALNYGGWGDGETDGLLYAMHAASPEGKPAAAGALFAQLAEQVPIVPIAFKNGSVLTQWGRLSGLSPVRGNAFNGLASWNVS